MSCLPQGQCLSILLTRSLWRDIWDVFLYSVMREMGNGIHLHWPPRLFISVILKLSRVETLKSLRKEAIEQFNKKVAFLASSHKTNDFSDL